MTISEIFLDFGRVLGEIMLLTMGLVNNRVLDVVCLCVMTVCVVLYFVHTVIIRKNPQDELAINLEK